VLVPCGRATSARLFTFLCFPLEKHVSSFTSRVPFSGSLTPPPPLFRQKLSFFSLGCVFVVWGEGGVGVFVRVCGFTQCTFPLPILTVSKPLLRFTFSLSEKPQESRGSTWMCEWFWEFCLLVFGVSGSDYVIDWMIQREMLVFFFFGGGLCLISFEKFLGLHY
jgi:hypothetical protein